MDFGNLNGKIQFLRDTTPFLQRKPFTSIPVLSDTPATPISSSDEAFVLWECQAKLMPSGPDNAVDSTLRHQNGLLDFFPSVTATSRYCRSAIRYVRHKL